MRHLFLAASLFVCIPSWADETYPEHLWYIGGGYGISDSGLYKLPDSIDTYSAFDTSGKASKLFFGKHITENIDFEVFYANLGRSYQLGSTGWYSNINTNSYGVSVKYFPTVASWRPYIKFGVHKLNNKESGFTDNQTFFSGKSKSVNALYGLGFEVVIRDGITFSADYESYGKTGSREVDIVANTTEIKPKAFYLSVVYSYGP